MCFLVGIGLVLGAIVGAIAGVALGYAWTKAFDTSCFEGYCGMLVFFTFMPIGALAGAGLGAVGFAMLGSRKPNSDPPKSGSVKH